ncbi:hypothetical protein [Streptomyces sp. HUAS ZL42]|uniref:hypothetical protein n=1 Tax=Streptomyces sp. HUAS ZL42 TaxID=3231715 RepID=UPI00345EDBAF
MTGVVVLSAFGGVASYSSLAPYGSVSTHGSVSAYAASASVTPSASASDDGPNRAGSRAGEGRQRPGRDDEEGSDFTDTDAPADDTDTGTDDSTVVPEPPGEAGLVPSAPPEPMQHAASQEEQPAVRVLRILPLGSGLLLIGLGLGTAFLALRLRRG